MRLRALIGSLGLVLLAPTVLAQSVAERLAAAELTLDVQPQAVEAVWSELTAQGLPLITAHDQDADLSRVTFLYKAAPDVRAVRLDSVIAAGVATQPVEDYLRDFTVPMSRIGRSSIWQVQLDVSRRVEATYSFLVERDTGWERRGDPLNRRRLRGSNAEAVLRLDQAPDRTALRPWPQRLARTGETRFITSEALGRDVRVTLHPADHAGADAPVLVLYDAFLWNVRAPAWEILANLALAGDIPPTHLVLIDQLDEASADAGYADQLAFLGEELRPWLGSDDGPGWSGSVLLAGASRRGLVAVMAALAAPQSFAGAISLSGSFYWSPSGEPAEWLARQVAEPEAGRAAIYLAAGELEYIHTSTNAGHVMLDTNRRMAAVLEAAGYPVQLDIFAGGHDVAAWRYALADGLVALLGESAER